MPHSLHNKIDRSSTVHYLVSNFLNRLEERQILLLIGWAASLQTSSTFSNFKPSPIQARNAFLNIKIA